MADTLNKKVRDVWIKCSINLFLEQAGRVLLIAGVLAVSAILIERLFGFPIINAWVKWGLWIVLAILIFVFWLRSLPNRIQVSVLVDKKMKFQERFSTAHYLPNQKTRLHRRRDEAHKAAEKIDPARQFPLRLSQKWLYACTVWLEFCTFDGISASKGFAWFFETKEEKQQQAQLVEITQKQIAQAAKDVTAAVKQLNESNGFWTGETGGAA